MTSWVRSYQLPSLTPKRLRGQERLPWNLLLCANFRVSTLITVALQISRMLQVMSIHLAVSLTRSQPLHTQAKRMVCEAFAGTRKAVQHFHRGILLHYPPTMMKCIQIVTLVGQRTNQPMACKSLPRCAVRLGCRKKYSKGLAALPSLQKTLERRAHLRT